MLDARQDARDVGRAIGREVVGQCLLSAGAEVQAGAEHARRALELSGPTELAGELELEESVVVGNGEADVSLKLIGLEAIQEYGRAGAGTELGLAARLSLREIAEVERLLVEIL